MTKFTKTALALIVLLCADLFNTSNACTSVIISGKITEDGRPIMWKNRDAGGEQNMLMYFSKNDVKGGKYAFIGVVAPNTTKPAAVWGGTNEKGLCIMNTMSYNVNIKGTEGKKTSSGNGPVQKQALAKCADMEEFEAFLKSLPQPTGLSTNLGVIDAKGNCAYFECHNWGYTKYDVNESPDGYIVRSNFSISTHDAAEGSGQIRYMEAERQVRHAIADKNVNVDYILKNLARSFSNPFLGINLKSGNFNKPKTNGWYADEDFITRYTSLSSMIFQGVKEGEKAELTTMWTLIGYPAASVCMPAWVKGGKDGIPALLAPDKTLHSPMSDKANTLRKTKVYTFALDTSDKNYKKYFNWEELYNLQGSGIMQKVMNKEAEILPAYKAALESWRKANKVNAKEIVELNKAADADIAAFYKEEFGI